MSKEIENKLMILSNWIYAAGLSIVAFGETRAMFDQFNSKKLPSYNNFYIDQDEDKRRKDEDNKIVAIGEYIESISNLYIGINEKTENQIIGNLISSLGSSLSGVGSDLQIIEETDEHLILEALGDFLQAIGPIIQIHEAQPENINVSLSIESLGAFLETIGILIIVSDNMKFGQTISAVGSWLQFAGGFLIAYFLTIKKT